MTEPKRILETRSLDPQLKDALRALQQDGPSPEVAARTLRALESLPPSAARKPRGSYTTLAGSSAVAVLAGVAALFAVARGASEMRHSTGPLERPVVSDPAPAEPAAASGADSPKPALPAWPAWPPAPSAHVDDAAPHVDSRGSSRSRRDPAASRPSRKSASLAGSAAAPGGDALGPLQPSAAEVSQLQRDGADPVAEQRATAAAAPGLPRSASTPAAPEPVDEAGLLFRAKRLEAREPAHALRLLEIHAFYFPHGTFVEEREVMMIKLHERLGHAAEVKARQARFRARFPNSVYRGAALP